jgi:hypothetical protein
VDVDVVGQDTMKTKTITTPMWTKNSIKNSIFFKTGVSGNVLQVEMREGWEKYERSHTRYPKHICTKRFYATGFVERWIEVYGGKML